MTPRLRSCLVALAVLIALTGCGDDDDPAGGDDTVDVDPDTGDASDDGDDSDASDEPDDTDDTDSDDPGDDESGEGEADDDAFVERAVDDLVGASELEPEMARCIASAVLETAGGAEAFREAGLDEESWFATSESFDELGLPADDAAVDDLAEGLRECGDGHELLFTTAGTEVPDDVRACVTDAVDEADVRRELARSIVRSQDAPDEGDVDVFGVVRRCEDDAQPG